VADLRQKVKNALDEVRILVLGSQVLLGFQYRAFFENGYERLPAADRALELAALAALLVTLGVLFLAPARHRIVEQGLDSERFHRFTMRVMSAALLPFACALALDVGVAGDRILGPLGGAACGVGTAFAALALWYGRFAHRSRRKRSDGEDVMEKTPLEHRIVQVLTEARVVIPGAQAMLGFQLAMVLMAPAACHRIVEQGEDTERFHTFASRMVLFALALLAPGFSGELYVVLQRIGLPTASVAAPVGALLCFYGAWFGAMFWLRSATDAAGTRRHRHAAARTGGD
jgi:hypothetical protein